MTFVQSLNEMKLNLVQYTFSPSLVDPRENCFHLNVDPANASLYRCRAELERKLEFRVFPNPISKGGEKYRKRSQRGECWPKLNSYLTVLEGGGSKRVVDLPRRSLPDRNFLGSLFAANKPLDRCRVSGQTVNEATCTTCRVFCGENGRQSAISLSAEDLLYAKAQLYRRSYYQGGCCLDD